MDDIIADPAPPGWQTAECPGSSSSDPSPEAKQGPTLIPVHNQGAAPKSPPRRTRDAGGTWRAEQQQQQQEVQQQQQQPPSEKPQPPWRQAQPPAGAPNVGASGAPNVGAFVAKVPEVPKASAAPEDVVQAYKFLRSLLSESAPIAWNSKRVQEPLELLQRYVGIWGRASRGPPAPMHGGPQFWRGQTWRKSGKRWGNRGGSGPKSEWYASKYGRAPPRRSLQDSGGGPYLAPTPPPPPPPPPPPRPTAASSAPAAKAAAVRPPPLPLTVKAMPSKNRGLYL